MGEIVALDTITTVKVGCDQCPNQQVFPMIGLHGVGLALFIRPDTVPMSISESAVAIVDDFVSEPTTGGITIKPHGRSERSCAESKCRNTKRIKELARFVRTYADDHGITVVLELAEQI